MSGTARGPLTERACTNTFAIGAPKADVTRPPTPSWRVAAGGEGSASLVTPVSGPAAMIAVVGCMTHQRARIAVGRFAKVAATQMEDPRPKGPGSRGRDGEPFLDHGEPNVGPADASELRRKRRGMRPGHGR
jgi:hypothetical protein